MFAMLLLLSAAATAQIKVPGTNVTFDFPSSDWKFQKTFNYDKKTTAHLYAYIGKKFVDPTGEATQPFMLVYAVKDYKQSIFDFIQKRYEQQPYWSIYEYMENIPGDEGMGHIAAYTNPSDQNDYKLQMIHFKDKNTAFEIRLETTIDTYDAMEEEFGAILKSVKISQ